MWEISHRQILHPYKSATHACSYPAAALEVRVPDYLRDACVFFMDRGEHKAILGFSIIIARGFLGCRSRRGLSFEFGL